MLDRFRRKLWKSIQSVLGLVDPPVQRIGFKQRHWLDIYHFLLNTRWSVVLSLFGFSFFLSNLLFAFFYFKMSGCVANARPDSFWDHFHFSVQTMTTIGYGYLHPVCNSASVLTSIEAFIGLLSLALITGLIFSKFSKPTAKVIFSRVAVIRPFDGKPTLMVRIANARSNRIIEANVSISLLVDKFTKEGDYIRNLVELKLVRSHSPAFALTWTVMHEIDSESPFYGETRESLKEKEAELLVNVFGVDDTFNQTVHARYSYAPEHLIWNAKLVDILFEDEEENYYIDFTMFHRYKILPQALPDEEHRKVEEILLFWFGDFTKKFQRRWFQKDEKFDALMRKSHSKDYEKAARGEYAHWATFDRGALALIVLFDQFSRNMFRNSEKAYATDKDALDLSLHLIQTGRDKNFHFLERCFVYMPLMHSEDIEIHKKAKILFRNLWQEAKREGYVYKDTLRSSYEYELEHSKVIERYGRYPHRNEFLGRENTFAEERFLSKPGSRF